ncbi:hypothetical protein ACFV6B_29830 [Streptomyces microflavus]
MASYEGCPVRPAELSSVELRGAENTPLGSFSPMAELGRNIDIIA